MRASVHSGIVALLAAALLQLGCATRGAPTQDEPSTAPRRPVAAAHDSSGLTFFLPREAGATATTRRATAALREAMTRAGYHVVDDALNGYDAEIVPGSIVWARALDESKASPSLYEQVRFRITLIADKRVIDSTRSDFVAVNGEVLVDDVIPALNALGESNKVARFSSKLQRDREAKARTTASR